MLELYDDKMIRIVTADGEGATGLAEAFPSGYGLSEFGREEECLCIGDETFFFSDIRKIEVIPNAPREMMTSERYNDLIAELLEEPYLLVDVFPAPAPEDDDGRCFSAAKYFMSPDRLRALREKFASVIIKMSFYYKISASFDNCATWEEIEPFSFVRRLRELSAGSFLRVLLTEEKCMIDVEPSCTFMTYSGKSPEAEKTLRALAAAEGLFVRGETK
ncbi:MAG: hypothetical protein IJT70_04340 [Clostridia bacterium]|nr:hypothetical protein [Clostridia bacterium]